MPKGACTKGHINKQIVFYNEKRGDRMESFSKTDDLLTTSRTPVIFWIVLVYIAALVLQYIEDFALLKSVVFTSLIGIHIYLHWIAHKFYGYMNWYYLIVQGALIFFAAFLLPDGSPVILIGLLTLLIAQSITKLQSVLKVFIIFILYYSIYCVFIVSKYGVNELPLFILVLFFILIIVVVYSVIYSRQVKTRIRMEYYLKELELAHQKVEELALLNERQRMARDLHDTLAQGLAGLVMQLEALDAHLAKSNVEKSRSIVHKSMRQARETLRNARKAIDDLRAASSEYENFDQGVRNIIDEFKEFSELHVKEEMDEGIHLSSLTTEHCLFILSECLTNIVKHAFAKEVHVRVTTTENELVLKVKDDGIGFSPEKSSRQTGKYGLLGLKERVRLLNGELTIESIPAEGTEVTVIVPI